MPTEDIFSIRIVVADHYMCRPVAGLDPCYSEFRACEIKSVPVVRIFGSNCRGEKTCMHVHGVFPYFYVPYENSGTGSIDTVFYQVASSVDKAVNISLGQGNSLQQHVFKIQLVKGIPFYGYHKKEHQFLKIYIYNPRFVKRIANLFQNGVILGKIFQPHESHVPYILQFFIDYNLYGMSFLHAPKETVKFRAYKVGEEPSYVNRNQILDNVARVSTSQHEVDVAATFILNRFQLSSRSSAHTNPGIESIWQDERTRREILVQENKEIPSLKVPISQEREGISPTESDIFFRTALNKIIHELEANVDQSLNTSMDITYLEKKSKFNLKKLLLNAIYPQECSQEEVLTDASIIQDHYSNQSLFHESVKKLRSRASLSVSSANDSIVDEELVMNLSQNKLSQAFREQDFDLLQVMQQLEEDEQDENLLNIMQKLEEGEIEIDLDSSLAPLSETPKFTSVLKKSEDGNKTIYDSHDISDSDEDINDFTLVVEDVDEVLAKFSQNISGRKTESIPQMDGADDCRTPTKRGRKNGERISEQKSPRTPRKRSLRYTPLQITTRKSPRKFNGKNQSQNEDEVIVINDDDSNDSICNQRSKLNLRGSGTSIKIIEQNCVASVNGHQQEVEKDGNFNSNVDNTFITCNLSSRKMEQNKEDINKLKVYEVSTKSLSIKNLEVLPVRKCKVKLKKLTMEETMKIRNNCRSRKKQTNEKRCRSPSDVAREYDRRNNFFPEPGPSHINYYKFIDVPNPELPKKKSSTPLKDITTFETSKGTKSSDYDGENDLNVCSFYDKSVMVDSPSMFSDSSPASSRRHHFGMKSISSTLSNSKQISNSSSAIITPLELPPTFEEQHC